MQRITQKDLEALARRINEVTGSPATAYTRCDNGTFRANVGNYHISYAYGGAALQRMSNERGAVSSPLGGGYGPKRALWEQMHAFLAGLSTEATL